jgi:hypothetical protein
MTTHRLDVLRLYQLLDGQRQDRGMSWRALAREAGCPASLFTKMRAGGAPNANALVTLLVWLDPDADLPIALAGQGGPQ